jgi:hypothetical protein
VDAFENLVELRQTINLQSSISPPVNSARDATSNVDESTTATLGSTFSEDLDQSLVVEADQLLGSFHGMVTSLVSTMRAQLTSFSPPLTATGSSSGRKAHQSGKLDLSMDSSIFGADQSAILGSDMHGSSQSEAVMATILERYSDRFADLISEKVAKKLGSTMNSSGVVSPPL